MSLTIRVMVAAEALGHSPSTWLDKSLNQQTCDQHARNDHGPSFPRGRGRGEACYVGDDGSGGEE